MNRDDDVFAEALELSAEERPHFLEGIGRQDPALRERVESLLAGFAAAGGFMETSAVERPAALPDAQPGDRIGPYVLLRKLGDGGCGVVYLAEQTQPVRRHVALKVIKLGMDTNEVIARFTAERQALAMMDHPDIARVFDAGSTEAGRPYFVMEYVNGTPVTAFCDEHHLDISARLELFARICLAIQHAHQKGIIHRDIKPSNILVSHRDGVPTPKVIDFGIAKATQGRLTEHTLMTGLHQFIGTPAYMSPEQAELRDFDIDTRSDVYSLGVLLYELLTSKLPFDPVTLTQGGIDEIRRIIREVEPPRPSNRLSRLDASAHADIASVRALAAGQLRPVLRGDLDWIVMRCLEKERHRRYATAQELADDIRRFLRREPVEARPPTTAYRIQRFVARNRLACASAAAIFLALVVGTVVSTRQAIRATRAEQLARAERDAATAAGHAEALARSDAERRQEQAEDLLAFMLGDFRTELQKIGRLELLDAVGAKAMDYFAALDPRDLTDTALTRQSRALTQIGEIRMSQARYPEAAAAFTAAYDRAAALTERYPENADMLFERAQAEFWIGFVARRRGEFATEREWITRYRDSALALAELEGPTLRARNELIYGHHNLAVLEFDRGDLEAARAAFSVEHSTILSLLESHGDDPDLQLGLVDIVSWLGTVAERSGNPAAALRWFTEMADHTAAGLIRHPDDGYWQFRRAQAFSFIGDLHANEGDFAETQRAYQKAEPIFERLVARDAENRLWRSSQLSLMLQQVAINLAAGRREDAVAKLEIARAGIEGLVEAEPSSRKFARHLVCVRRLEALHLALVDPASSEAEAATRRAIDLADSLVEGDVQRLEREILGEFARAHALAGRLALARNDTGRANVHWRRIVDVLGPLLDATHDWRLLEPAVLALQHLDEPDRSAPLEQRLRAIGFHSLDPLAAPRSGAVEYNPKSRYKP